MSHLHQNNGKIFVVCEKTNRNKEFKNQKWICEDLVDRLKRHFPYKFTNKPSEAFLIWFFSPWMFKKVPDGLKSSEWLSLLKSKKVIFTQHHIDPTKLDQYESQFKFMNTYGDGFQAICRKTQGSLEQYVPASKIFCLHLFGNPEVFHPLKEDIKESLRQKYKFGSDAFLVGSFQKDTEGGSNLPKLSKGPDIFLKIIEHMHQQNTKVEVILSGLRREYIIKGLQKLKIKYHYFNMVSLEQLNELYNCLNLYLISSRCEGGPYSIFEAGLCQTPLISTKVGIAPEVCHPESLFDSENWESYQQAEPHTDYLHRRISERSGSKYMDNFLKALS